MATPTLVQHTSTTNCLEREYDINRLFYLPLPNATLSGNLVIIAVHWDGADNTTVSATDDQAQSYTVALRSHDAAGQDVAILYKLNSAAGAKLITIEVAARSAWMSAAAAEFCNVATSTPDVTTASATGTSTSWQATGSLAGNATGGLPYLIFQIGATRAFNTQTSFAPQSGFELGCAHLAGQSTAPDNYGELPYATQWGVVTAPLSNPIITAGVSVAYNSVAVAFKSASAGTPIPAVPRIVHCEYNEYDHKESSPTVLQFPCTGGVLVACVLDNDGDYLIETTGITDSNDNEWLEIDESPGYLAGAGRHHMLYAENATPSNDLVVNVAHTTLVSGYMVIFMDIVNANKYIAGNVETGTKGTTGNLPSVSITPTAINQLIIGYVDHAEGTEHDCVTDANGHLPTMQTAYVIDVDGDSHSYFHHDSGCANYLTADTDPVQFIWSRSATAPGAWVGLAGIFAQATETPIEVTPQADTLMGGKVRFTTG